MEDKGQDIEMLNLLVKGSFRMLSEASAQG